MILTQEQRLMGLSPELLQRAAAIREAMRMGEFDDAERMAKMAITMSPRHPEILHLYGQVQNLRGRHAQALGALLQARIVRSTDALIYSDMGAAYEALHDFDRARKAFQVACQVGPEYPSCWFNFGRRLMRDGDSEAAISSLRRAIELEPLHAPARAMLAAALEADGRSAEAKAEFRRITQETPRAAAAAWSGLATLKPMPLDEADIATMEHALDDAELDDPDRISIGFALAMAYEHTGNYARALDTLATAHAISRKKERYDAAGFGLYLDSILAAFPGNGAVAATRRGDEVIFIAGLPRSGSTLIEQILASHSSVEGAIELIDLPAVLMNASERFNQPFPQWAAARSPEEWQELGETYLLRTAKWRASKPKFTDKSPGNWQYVGAILSMLPNARVIVARRDPLETCLGCYRYMLSGYAYAHDFSDLAAHWRDFDRAVAHWREAYPAQFREQSYERLVAEPEAQIRALLDFCGLPFEAACMDFHTTQRRVTTPSASQVREPLRGDTARGERYGALLDPLRAALGQPPFGAR